jgi:outer membrane murein-binding lipoprotein Lpp
MKKNSMFKLRSGNKPSMSKLAGVSPMKDNGNDEAKQQKIKELEAKITQVKSDMDAGRINKLAAVGTLRTLTQQLMKLTGGKAPN